MLVAALLTVSAGSEDQAGGGGAEPAEGQMGPAIAGIECAYDVFEEDTAIAAIVREGVEGAVRFELRTYAGELLWSGEAPVADGRASAAMPGAELSGIDKGECVLIASASGHAGAAYKGVCLRGRVFRDVTEAPADMRPGDEIVITDPALLEPASAIAPVSGKGTWWRRAYS
ncbi:MAG: hypothetical protein JXR94_03535, partial [Candidatus Hydrogenedentes bacterium]|nr:hypothetical protein [Candidatus Hydrogenedentota bacterium]